ncbi:glycosyltransferase family 2 protein [Asticcacaulis sp. DXS10W]|uniref:Glycosyltransferase family 2 protein n=1 Tax=Asticcacaulis currens TaxID=2984210 RepID=A0ABT5IBC9_9CAUL|nr:glycosyltransferase family 2 protein [Asticcacaulis currens]MDC7692771.1 glycosyltransferase family 2 protein [Asticcacaulis currens]
MMIDDVLIVIPCLNEETHIESVIRQLMTEPRPNRFLVVVADGGSTDRTCEIVINLSREFSRLRLVHNPKRIQASAINLAVRTFGAHFKYLLRIDAHSGYPARFLDRLSQQLVVTDAQSVVVPLEAAGTTTFQKIVAIVQNSRLGTGGSAHRHKGCNRWVDHGHHALFDLKTFCNLGGYNEDFPYNEDAEFDYRLTGAGCKIWLAGTLPIKYYPRKTLTSLYKQYFRYGSGRASTVKAHKTPLKLRQWAPVLIVPLCGLGVLGALAEQWLLALPAVSWATTCNFIAASLAIRHRDINVLCAGIVAMAMHFAWSAGFWRSLLLKPRAGATELAPLKVEKIIADFNAHSETDNAKNSAVVERVA